jgi:hypothetical protein
MPNDCYGYVTFHTNNSKELNAILDAIIGTKDGKELIFDFNKIIVQFGEIVNDFGTAYLIHVFLPKPFAEMVFPKTVLLPFCLIRTVFSAFRAKLFKDFFDCAPCGWWLYGSLNSQVHPVSFTCFHSIFFSQEMISVIIGTLPTGYPLTVDAYNETVFPETFLILIHSNTLFCHSFTFLCVLKGVTKHSKLNER